MIRKILEYPVYGFNVARFLHFKTQNAFLSLLVEHLPGIDKNLIRSKQNPALTKILLKELNSLLRKDAQNIVEGIYPWQVLLPEVPTRHMGRLPWLLWDGLKIYHRRLRRSHKSFSRNAEEYFEEVPEYFRRNYHFQTDGYLSESSAELYDHQVELLFSGAADAMRRILIRPLKELMGTTEQKNFLEIACGTGRMTRFMKLAFPKAKFIATDLSRPYISVARRKLADLPRIDLLQADATQLPFKDESFDLVYSVFMFHELPPDVRLKVIQESSRVLKPGGFMAMVDSVQLRDFEDAKSALEQFPVDFHEPFYKNYIENQIEDLFEANGFRVLKANRGFLSKAVVAQKLGG